MSSSKAGATAVRMRAWRIHSFGSTSELQLDSVRVPTLRRPTEVLIRVRMSSINPIDLAMIGGYGARALGAARSALEMQLGGWGAEAMPLTCGRDLCGEVVLRGPEAGPLRGRVWAALPAYVTGAHAEYAVADAAWVGQAPQSMDDASAGGTLYCALSACAASRAGGEAHSALLLGLGGVGRALLQLLVARNVRVAVVCAEDQLQLARDLGAEDVLSRSAPDHEDRLSSLGTVDVVFDTAGLGGSAAEGLSRRVRFSRFVTLTSPLLRETDARGLALGSACALVSNARQSADARAPVRWAFVAPRSSDLQHLRALVDAGKLSMQVERVFPCEEGRAAYESAERGPSRGKILIDFTK